MKKILLGALILTGTEANANYQKLESRISELEDKLSDVELNQALQKFNISGSYLTHVESFHAVKEGNNPLTGSDNRANQNQYLTPIGSRLELNFDINITQSMSLYSTLSMAKFWNLDERTGRSNSSDSFKSLQGGYSYSGDQANFDVAYLSYSNKNTPWSFAIGRMTTNDGPPLNQNDGLSRQGTYPAHLYNVVLDGAAVIYNFGHMMPEDEKLKMRLFYTPFIYVDSDRQNRQVQDSGSDKDSIDSRADLVTLLTEYSKKNVLFSKSFDFIHGIYNVDGFYESTQQNPTTASADFFGTTLNSLYFGFNDFLTDGLNISLSYSHSILKIKNQNNETGNSYLIGANYKIKNFGDKGHIVGAEYIRADKNKIPSDETTDYIASFYNSTNSYGLHLFYTIPFGFNQIVRVGYFDYFEGDSDTFAVDYETEITSTYLTWKLFF